MRRARMVRAVLVDLGGVILHLDWRAAAADWEPALGLSPGGFLRALFGGSDATALIGEVSEEAWWEVVRGRLGISVKRLDEIRADLRSRESIDMDLLGGLVRIRARARLAIVTNAWSGARQTLIERGIADVVDEAIISAEVGVAKPGPAIYHLAAARLGASPGECVFIDDTPENVVAAEACGMAGVRHVSSEETLRALARQPFERLPSASSRSASRMPSCRSPDVIRTPRSTPS